MRITWKHVFVGFVCFELVMALLLYREAMLVAKSIANAIYPAMGQ